MREARTIPDAAGAMPQELLTDIHAGWRGAFAHVIASHVRLSAPAFDLRNRNDPHP
jgi:hypothetical protein